MDPAAPSDRPPVFDGWRRATPQRGAGLRPDVPRRSRAAWDCPPPMAGRWANRRAGRRANRRANRRAPPAWDAAGRPAREGARGPPGGRKVPTCKLPVRAPHRLGSVLGPPGRGGCALWVLRGPPPRSARPGRRPKPHAALLRRVAPPAPSPVQPPQSPFQLTQADSPRRSHPGRHATQVGRSAHTGFPRSARLSPEHPVP